MINVFIERENYIEVASEQFRTSKSGGGVTVCNFRMVVIFKFVTSNYYCMPSLLTKVEASIQSRISLRCLRQRFKWMVSIHIKSQFRLISASNFDLHAL